MARPKNESLDESLDDVSLNRERDLEKDDDDENDELDMFTRDEDDEVWLRCSAEDEPASDAADELSDVAVWLRY